MKITSLLTIAALTFASAAYAQEAGEHGKDVTKAEKGEAPSTTVKGEIMDITCYVDHGAKGEKHSACAEKCISSGLPVGIKTDDGKLYTVIGDHKPINKELAAYAGKEVTLRGKVTSKDGVNLLENAEVVK
jgi:hypothetical protein